MHYIPLKKGFTLLEILLVITLIGILSGIILSAINPSRQLAQARDAERLSEIRKISNALDMYTANNRGEYPSGLTSWYKDICPVGGGIDCVDLSVLVPTYIDSIPVDPDGVTNYRIGLDTNTNQVSFESSISEVENSITVNPLPSVATFAKRSGGIGYDAGLTTDTFSDGSFVVTGTFAQTATFGQGDPNQTSLVSAGNADISIIKYNADGSLAWAKRAGGTGLDRANDIKSYEDGSFLVTGYFSGTATFGQGDPNQTSLVSAGMVDVFIARYNADGTLVQVRRFGGSGNDTAISIDTFSDGSTVITGGFQLTVTFGQGEPNQTTLVSAGSYDMFVSKYNVNGTLAWVRRVGVVSADELGYGVVSNPDGSSVVSGTFFGTVIFGQGEPNQTSLTSAVPGSFVNRNDLFIAKYNPDGTLAWAKKIGGVENESVLGIDKFSDGSTIITGSFWGVATFGLGETNQTVLNGTFPSDMFIAKYNPDGTLAWAKKAGSSQNIEDTGYGVATYPDGSSVVVGEFANGTIFGEGEVNQTTLFAPSSLFGMFLAKYSSTGNLIWVKNVVGQGFLSAYGVSKFNDGNIIVTGDFSQTPTFGQGDVNQTTLTAAGDYDMFIAKYNADGRLE